jgi:Icc-related predicted phosphoesterase
MKLLVFSDLHGDRAALERLMAIEADIYVNAGDLSNFSRGLDGLGLLMGRRAARLWVLPGNHEHESRVESFCTRHGFHVLHKTYFEKHGVHIAGVGHSNPTPFNTPGEDSEETIEANLAPFSELKPLILICHCPPIDTALDDAGRGRHFGSRAVREFIDRHQPDWFFCGHIHEAAGREITMGKTRAMNVGKKGYLLELPG